jgi:hypothetical protein
VELVSRRLEVRGMLPPVISIRFNPCSMLPQVISIRFNPRSMLPQVISIGFNPRSMAAELVPFPVEEPSENAGDTIEFPSDVVERIKGFVNPGSVWLE